MNGWTIGTDIGVMLTGVSVLVAGGLWSVKELRRSLTSWQKRKHRLLAGESLKPGATLHSPDGRTSFTLHPNGNMVVEVDGYGVFDDTATGGPDRVESLTLSEAGKLALVGVDGREREIAQAGPGAHLEVQNDAHVVLYTTSDEPAWYTNWYLLRGQPVGPQGPQVIFMVQRGDAADGPGGEQQEDAQ
jgi:hypothetical protein